MAFVFLAVLVPCFFVLFSLLLTFAFDKFSMVFDNICGKKQTYNISLSQSPGGICRITVDHCDRRHPKVFVGVLS